VIVNEAEAVLWRLPEIGWRGERRSSATITGLPTGSSAKMATTEMEEATCRKR
jgi:hypothetical protein